MTKLPTPTATKTALFIEVEAVAKRGRWLEAIELWQQIIRLDTQDPSARVNLGLTLARAGRWAEAVDAYGDAFRLGLPEDQVLVGLGLVFCMREQFDIAQENLEKAVALNPDNLSAWSNLVVAYSRLGLVDRAIHAADQVLARRPDDTPTLSALGTMCKDAGMPNEAINWFQRAIDAAPNNVQDFSNLLWAMLHSDAVTSDEIVTAARQFDQRVRQETGTQNIGLNVAARPTPDKIRIGWVSGDIRLHPVGFFVIPVLEHLDHDSFESIIYSNSYVMDELTLRAKNACSCWREISGLGDDQVAELVGRDRIDILVELSGHTGGNRLTVFARRAAPIQVTWLGFPGTSGLSAMDYILVPPDPVLLAGHWCTEIPMALPACYYVLDPFRIPLPVPSCPPCDVNGFITFGCLNNFTKVSPSAMSTWAHILRELPNARLVLVATGGNDQSLVADIKNRFASMGVDFNRLTIHGRMDYDTYLATYRELDIALDPFPFNGGTTGIDCLYMGTPYITMQGQALHSRLGSNLLRVLDLQELTASCPDEYVRMATALAGDRARLKKIRNNLRSSMEHSPLMDVAAFARGLEQIFTEMRLRDGNPQPVQTEKLPRN